MMQTQQAVSDELLRLDRILRGGGLDPVTRAAACSALDAIRWVFKERAVLSPSVLNGFLRAQRPEPER